MCSNWKTGHSLLHPTGRPPSLLSSILLLIAGDVEVNPGPAKHPCGSCSKAVKSNQRGIFCEVCYLWYHTKCINMCLSEYQRLSLSDEGWCCHHCHKEALPFHDCSTLTSVSDSSSDLSLQSSCSTSSNCSPPSGRWSAYYSNCRSLVPKIDNLRTIAASATPSVIALCETWLDESVPELVLFIPNYHILRRDRNRHGGGLLLYISDDIPSTCLRRHSSLELLVVELKLNQGPLINTCTVLSPPFQCSQLRRP